MSEEKNIINEDMEEQEVSVPESEISETAKLAEVSEQEPSTEQAANNDTPSDTPAEEKKPALPPHKEYAKRTAQFNNFYIQLLCCVGVMIAIGIVAAVIYNVLFGVIIAVVGAVLYTFLASDEMFKKLGIRYTSGEGGITVLACRAKYGDVMWIPSTLIGFDVIKIGDSAFRSAKNQELKRVFLPESLKEIGSDIFEGCDALTDIYFQGSKEQWEKIEKKTDLSGYRITFDAKYPPIPKKKKKKAITKDKASN